MNEINAKCYNRPSQGLGQKIKKKEDIKTKTKLI